MLSIEFRVLLCAAALFAVPAAAAPHASTRAAPECAKQVCTLESWSDRSARDVALLTVDGHGPKPLHFYYASDGGARAAQFVRDAAGCDYVLLEYGLGHGPTATVYLAVLRLGDRAELLRKARLRIWISPGNAAEYRYAVVKPFEGGLTIQLTRHFTGKNTNWRYPPPTEVVSIPPND